MRRGSPGRPSRSHPTRHLLYAFLVGAFITALGFTLARCDPSQPAGRAASRTTALVVIGSETLRPLVSACAEALMMQRPEIDVVVRGGGSSTGVAALLAGQTDLAMISRDPTAAERAAAGDALRLHPLASEAIAIIVHAGVAVDTVDHRVLRELLSGQIATWTGAGGPGEPVVVVSRTAGSGTAAVIEDRVLSGTSIAAGALREATHEEVIARVAATRGAIGYADAHLAGQDDRVRILALQGPDETRPHRPDDESIRRGEYWLARTLSLVSMGQPSADGAALITRCRGPEGLRLVAAAGFHPPPVATLRAGATP